jgi:hypothetical protein
MALIDEPLTEREHKIVMAAEMYANVFSDTGLPGHNLLILIAKLNNQMQKYEKIAGVLAAQTPKDIAG